MMISSLWVSLLAASRIVAAQHVRYMPAQVERDVELMLDEFRKYTNYTAPRELVSQKLNPEVSVHSDVAAASCDYWLEDITHQGRAAFNSDPTGYQVFRNVMDFGATGNGVTDDTAAINAAISSGGRCAPGSCESSTVTPAVVYFPSGTYVISSSIEDYYYTQLIGNPNCLPRLLATPGFSGTFGLIDGDTYQSSTGDLGYGATNVFYRQIRNLILDMTQVPASSAVTGIHWPTAQATSIQNVQFLMNAASGTQHQGIFVESGSGGFMSDLTFSGGIIGANFGNQQFTVRNLVFDNVVTAINQIWDWGWTYKSITITNCQVGLDMSSLDGSTGVQNVGSVTFLDSSITNTPVGIKTARSTTSTPASGGSLIVENVSLDNVPVTVEGPSGTLLAGTTGTTTIAGWGQGHEYIPTGPTTFQGSITPNTRPASLVSGSKYYEMSKPQYATEAVGNFLSARSKGATGDGITDDTTALQNAINIAKSQGKILFVDHGDYVVTSTLYIPEGSMIVGESYSVIMSRGSYFNNINSPQPVVRIGNVGEIGSIQWSDMIVSTQGQQEGAVLIEYNLVSPSSTPSGLWDVHTRVGGFAGSDLQVAQCPTTAAQPNANCIAAYMSLYMSSGSSGLYMENNWFWTADHDIDDAGDTQISIYAGRGMLIESTTGTFWLVGTAVEHHTLYQYQFANTKDIFAGQIQTETPYYEPDASAPGPWPYNATINDPQFPLASVDGIPDADAWGLRILNSNAIFVYGAGLYSFFDNYSTACSDQGAGEGCQDTIVSIEGSSSNINIYNLNTVGVQYMITNAGTDTALYSDNLNGFEDTVALFRTG